jgi:acetylglutamate kinase
VSRNGSDELGAALNVNGDDAAAAIAIALGAAELLLVADVPGVLRDGQVIACFLSRRRGIWCPTGRRRVGCRRSFTRH